MTNTSNLLTTLKNLSRAEKFQAMQFLVSELAKEEEIQLQPEAIYSIASPLDSHEAAHKLKMLLDTDKRNHV